MKDYALYIFDWQDTITSSSDLGLSDKGILSKKYGKLVILH